MQDVSAYAGNLVNYIRANSPTATTDDIIGGAKIEALTPYTPPTSGPTLWGQAALCNVVLTGTCYPNYEKITPVALANLTALRTTLKLTLGTGTGSGFSPLTSQISFNSSDIYSHRLVVQFSASDVPSLLLDGVTQATGSGAVVAGNPLTIRTAIGHPNIPCSSLPSVATGTGSTTSGSTVISSVLLNCFPAAGWTITGSGIPANATVVSVNGSQITISAAATATGSANLTVTSPPTDTVHVTSGANAIFVVGTAWGGSDRGMIEKHRRLLQQNAAANPNPAAEPVLGEGLAMIGYTWLAEFTRVQQRVQEITGVTTSYLHAVGIIGMRTVTGGFQGPYVDLPLNTISLTQRSGHTSTSPTAPSPAEAAAFAADAGVSSVLESGSIEQTQPGATAVSTVKLLDLQSQSGAIFDINNTAIAGDNCSYYNGTIRPQLQTTYTATDLGRIDTLVGSSSNGAVCSAVPSTIRVIAPLNGALTINSSPPGSGSWTGTGYQQLLYTTAAQTSLGGVGNIITGGLSGGMPASNVPPPEIKSNQTGALSGSQYVFPSQGAGFNSSPVNTNIAANLGGSSNTQKTGGDPIDLVAGNYVYNHQDLSVGSGAFPDTLAFARTFDSGLAQTGRNTSLLGNGWMHSYDMTGLPDSDGFEGMGDNSPISGAAAIATLYVVQDLFQGAVGTTQLIVAAQAETWLMGQLTNNVATVTRPGSSERFTLLPSGAYNAPIGSPAVLTGTSAAGYLYHGGDGVSLTFNPTTAVASGRVTNWSSAAGASMAFSYNALGQLQAVCEPNCSSSRRRLNFTYAGNSLTSVNDGSGSTPRTVSFAYDANNNLSAVTDPLGYRTTFNYAGVGQLLQLSYPAAPGAPFLTNAYNSLGRPNQQADANGSVTTIHIAGSRAETIDPIGTSRVSYFSPRGRTLATIDGLGSADINGGAGNLTSYAYDGLDRVMEVTYPAGRSQSYTYDANSNPLSITSAPPSGSPLLTQNFTYVSPVSALPNFEQVSTATDPKGIVTSYGYDFFGNRISVIADSGSSPHINAKTTFTFDSVGRMLSSTDPLGAVTRMTYDGLGNLISSVKDSGRLNVTTGLSYDAVGNVLNLTDPNGNVTTSAWDADRRLSNTVSPAGSGGPLATTYSYDPNANLLQTQQSSNGNVLRTTSATYTLTGKVATSTDARGNVTRYAYDADDRLSQTTDPIGNVSVLGYDSLGRQASLSNAAIQANPLWQKTYSPDGLLASFSDAAPNTTSFAYDGFDRLSTTTWPNASTEVLTYDANGNALTRKTRVNATITYTYDTLNRLATKTPPSPAPVVSYAYDLNNHLTGVSDNSAAIVKPSSSASYSVAYAYDAMNRPVSATWPNVPAQTALTASSVSSSFTYDATNRRIGQTVSDDSWWSRPTAASPISYTANNLNQYTAVGSAHPTYDGNGNLTSDGHFTYCYDTESRLISVLSAGTCATPTTTVASYAYDAQGRRKSKTVGATTTNTVTDTDNREVLEYNGTSGALQNWYAFGLGPDEALNQISSAGATRATLIPDVIGSIAGSLDSGGTLTKYGYQTFGENPSLTSGGYRYTGRRLDPETLASSSQPSGLYYYRARTYSPTWGRFLQPDPIGYAGGANLYAYVGNDPLNRVDPLGLTPDAPNGGGGGAGAVMSDVNSPGIVPGAQYAQAAMGLCGFGPAGCAVGAGITAGQILGIGGAVIGGTAGAIILNNENQPSTPGDKPASTPTGQRGSPIDVTPGTNQPTTIGGRVYTGHGLDQMQGRGVPPSAVEDAIQNGQTSPGNTPGTAVHTGNNGVVVVTGENGQVITVINR